MWILNLTRGNVVANHATVAKHFFERLRGLIGSGPLQIGGALWIPTCQGIHTFGMTYPIDVVFLNQTGNVVRLVPEIPPNVLGPVSFQAKSTLELPSGAIAKLGIKLGNQLLFTDRVQESTG